AAKEHRLRTARQLDRQIERLAVNLDLAGYRLSGRAVKRIASGDRHREDGWLVAGQASARQTQIGPDRNVAVAEQGCDDRLDRVHAVRPEDDLRRRVGEDR